MIDILRDLVRCKSITPCDDGAIEYCSNFLGNLGFECQILSFEGVNNLYARLGNYDKNLCFAGHIDVVPAVGSWDYEPFDLTIEGDMVYGRGTNDMKGPLSSCLSAIRYLVSNNLVPKDLSLSVLLTGDEEIMGDNGMKSAIPYLKQKCEKITGCILCESCSPRKTGEYIKIGCRGSLNIDITSNGKQCHVANAPSLGNHLHTFIERLNSLCKKKLDDGNERFSPSSLQLTSIESINNVRNIVPQTASALLNIRFNDNWTHESLEEHIGALFPEDELLFTRYGGPFIGSSQEFVDILSKSMEKTNGKKPEVGTEGGNSDALSIRDITDVVEIGSEVCNAHIVNEYIRISDLQKLYNIYTNIITDF